MSDSASARGADIRLVPPLLFGLPLAAAVYADRFVPLPMPAGDGRDAFGAMLVSVGAAFAVSAMMVFAANRTTVIPNRAVAAMVTEGPYRFSRNPMYVGLVFIYIGVAVLFGTWWPLPALPVILYLMRRFVIDREEAYLRQLFGTAYDLYCSRVRRWL